MNTWPKRKAIVAAFLLALIVGCGSEPSRSSISFSSGNVNASTSKGRILFGSVVPGDVSPQIVKVATSSRFGESLCTGTVIAQGVVLTAAHCFQPASSEDSITSVVTVKGEYIASEVVLHPQFSVNSEVGAYFNDVALVKGAFDLPALPILEITPAPGDALITYGFGVDEFGSSGELKSGLTVTSLVTPNHIFVAPFEGDNPNPCSGDSGGPAVVSASGPQGGIVTGLVGIVSSGTVPSCGKGDVTLYTNLQNPSILEFIADQSTLFSTAESAK